MIASIEVTTLHDNARFSEGTEKSVLVVHLANMMTRKIGYSLFNTCDTDLSSLLESAKLLKISSDDLAEISEEITNIMKSSVGAF